MSVVAIISTENPDGFLSMKDFHRAVNVEMQAIKKVNAIGIAPVQ